MRALLLAGLVASSGASAQATFREDFEMGPLLAPSGQWDFEQHDDVNDTNRLVAEAARSGDAGMRITNALSTGAGSGNIGLGRYITGSGEQHVRVWFRPFALSAAAGFDSVLIVSRSNNFYTACQVYWSAPRRAWRLAAFNAANVDTLRDSDAGSAPVGSWHLVEMAVAGMGTSSGRCRAWADGILLGDVGSIDWSGLTFRDLSLGPVNASLGNASTYDYDGFAAAPQAMPGHLWVRAAPTDIGVCSPATVELQDVLGAPVAAPADMNLSLQVSSPVTLWADGLCSTATSTALVHSGNVSATVYFRSSAALDAGTLQASNPDLLDGVGTIVVRAGDGGMSHDDGGFGPDPRVRAVGCGCGSAPPALVLLLVAALRSARRR